MGFNFRRYRQSDDIGGGGDGGEPVLNVKVLAAVSCRNRRSGSHGGVRGKEAQKEGDKEGGAGAKSQKISEIERKARGERGRERMRGRGGGRQSSVLGDRGSADDRRGNPPRGPEEGIGRRRGRGTGGGRGSAEREQQRKRSARGRLAKKIVYFGFSHRLRKLLKK